MKTLSLLLLAAMPCSAQFLSAGIKAGVPLTDFVDTVESGRFNYFTHTNRYIIGATGEVRLPFGLGVEIDALYRHINYGATGTTSGITTTTTTIATTANAWEFPLLLKYRFPAPIARPFIDGGVAWDTLQGLKQSITNTIAGGGSTTVSNAPVTALNQTTTTGFVLGAGLDVHVLFLHLQPEIRYTRWGSQHFLDPNGRFGSNQNQGEFLLGITF